MPWRREGWRCRRRREGKMDRTLKRAKRSSKRRNHRNVGAWRRFSPDGTTCRFCEHDGSAHLCASAQPHFYRRATEEERGDPRVTLYRHDTPEGGSALVQAGGRRQPRRADNRLLYSLRRGDADRPGAVLPAHPRHRRGGGGRDKQHERRRTMTTNQTIYFTCPSCDERFAQVEELDRDIHTGEIYHCSLLRSPGDIPGGVRRGLRAATQGEEGLPLPQSRSPVHSPLQDDLQPD